MTAEYVPPVTPPQDLVTSEWLDDHLPGVFARGHQWLVKAQRASTDAIIEAAGVRPGYHVLDVGCGSGIPTIVLARRVGPSGRVTATDPSPVLIHALTENVREAGLGNVEIVQASAAALPFADATFDAATCHFGAMFFPNLTAGLSTIRRVLRPGRRAAFAGWGAMEDNGMLGIFFSTMARHLGPRPLPDNPRDAPWPMRFAEQGTLTAALESAGYDDVREDHPLLEIVWPGPPETLLVFWMDMANIDIEVPIETRAAIHSELQDGLQRTERPDGMHFTARVAIASGRAPV